MKHKISKELTLEEFKEAFSKIREEFIGLLVKSVSGYSNVKFLACNNEGHPISWVWNNDTFTHDKSEGSLEDAKQFVRHMIDQGMKFSFMGTESDYTIEIWLTTWEPGETGPTWPANKTILFEFIHEGVTRE